MRGRATFAGVLVCAAAIAAAPAQGLDPAPTTTTVGVRVTGESLHIAGSVLPAQPGGPVALTVLRRKRKTQPFRQIRSPNATINLEGTFATTVNRRRRGVCQVTATWAGDADSLPSSASAGFRC
jgi:hypothetical protein